MTRPCCQINPGDSGEPPRDTSVRLFGKVFAFDALALGKLAGLGQPTKPVRSGADPTVGLQGRDFRGKGVSIETLFW